MNFSRDEIDGDICETVTAATESWSDSSGRDCVFIGQWLSENEKVLSTIQWRSGDSAKPSWDGSLEGIIGSLHAQLAAKDRIFLELLRTSFEANQGLLNSLVERNAYLEKIRIETEKTREEIMRTEAELVSDSGNNERFTRLITMAEKVLLANFSKPEPPKS